MAFSNLFTKLCDVEGAVKDPSHRNEFKSGQESSSKMISQTMQTSPQRNQRHCLQPYAAGFSDAVRNEEPKAPEAQRFNWANNNPRPGVSRDASYRHNQRVFSNDDHYTGNADKTQKIRKKKNKGKKKREMAARYKNAQRDNTQPQNWYREEQEPEDHPDGQPYESNDEDPELARKRKELQVIQEQIMLKRASLTLKTVNPGLCTKETRTTESNETLRDKVKLILKQQYRLTGFKSPVVKTRRNSINIQHDHPLKHRVKVALQQRCVVYPTAKTQNDELIQFSRAAPCPKIDTPVEEEKGHQGFMRFLNILNKGVDIDKLKEMVIDDTERTSYPPQPLQPPQPQHNSESRGETYGETSSFTSQGQQNGPNPDEQQKHLQNILQSLGLSLGTDEIIKLSDRTQERLYGKRQKTEEGGKTLDEKPQMEMERHAKEGEKYSPAHYTRSSSSSSTFSLSSRRSPPKTLQSLLRQRSHSSSHRHRSSSSSHRYRSPPSSSHRRSRSPYRCRSTNSPYTRRDSRSPHGRRSTNSPYTRRDSRSPHGRRNTNSLYMRRDSHSPHRRRSTNSPYMRRDSRSPHGRRSTNSPYMRRDSRSPHGRRNTNSPYMRRDSRSPHGRRSPNPGDLRDPLLQFQPPTQAYPYPPFQCFSPHFPPPQMYPDPYSQYATYYNYWAYNQLPAPGSIEPSHQNYPQTIPPEFFNQQIEPHNSNNLLEPPTEETESNSSYSFSGMDNLAGTSNKHRTPCLVSINQMSIAESRKTMSRYQKSRQNQQIKARKKQQRREFIAETKLKQRVHVKLCNAAKQVLYPSWFPPADTSDVPPITVAKKKRKKKKNLVFTERTEEMEKLLNDRPGPVTRSLGKKNPAKLLDYNGKLMDIKDIEDPLRELWDDIPLNVSMARTVSEVITEPKEEKPVLTEEEIKANLKLKLKAFNSRMKKKDAQPAQLLTPHSVKVEDEI